MLYLNINVWFCFLCEGNILKIYLLKYIVNNFNIKIIINIEYQFSATLATIRINSVINFSFLPLALFNGLNRINGLVQSNLSSGLCYKQVLHSHLSIKLHFCVINIYFMVKCPYLRPSVHFYRYLAMNL